MMIYEVAIVGAGPIGIELAVALKEANISTVHFEAGQIGATIEWYAPGTTFFSSSDRISICGVPLETPNQAKATREEYLRYLRSVVRQFDLKIRTYDPVTGISKEKDYFKLISAGGETSAKRVVLAIGDMQLPNLLDIPGEDLPYVSHYFRDPHTYFGKKVLIVGGKNSAAEAAIRLYRIGCDVTLSYHAAELNFERIKFWIAPELRSLIASKSIKFLGDSKLKEIADHKAIFTVQGKESAYQYDFVLLLTGYCQDPSLFEKFGIELVGDTKIPVYDPETMETNIPEIFIAGTACAGSQVKSHKEFIETTHVHVNRIVGRITGVRSNASEKHYLLSES
jgi:thioredoxin reductase (NADPH)